MERPNAIRLNEGPINRWTPLKEIFGVFGAAVVILWIAGSYLGSEPLVIQILVWFIYLLVMMAIWWLQNRHQESWTFMGFKISKDFSWTHTLLKSLLTAAVATGAFLVIGMLAANLGWVPSQADLSGYDPLKGNLPLVLLTLMGVYISSSLGEEIVFRGFLITRLCRLFQGFYPRWWSILISGLIFGLVHVGWGPLGMIQTAAMGWTLGYFYLRFERNLWITVLAHAYMDTVLILQMY